MPVNACAFDPLRWPPLKCPLDASCCSARGRGTPASSPVMKLREACEQSPAGTEVPRFKHACTAMIQGRHILAQQHKTQGRSGGLTGLLSEDVASSALSVLATAAAPAGAPAGAPGDLSVCSWLSRALSWLAASSLAPAGGVALLILHLPYTHFRTPQDWECAHTALSLCQPRAPALQVLTIKD